MIAKDLMKLASPIEKLKPLPGNPRKGDVDAVMKSYERFGQRKPIVARRDGTVIAGNHQLEAAKRLGWKQIAVVWTDDDDETAKAFALADNRVGDLGTYDEDALLDLLLSVDLAGTGYSQDDLSEMMTRVDLPPPVEVPFDLGNGPGERSDASTLQWGYLQWRSVRVRINPDEVTMMNALYKKYRKEKRSDVGFGFHLVDDRVTIGVDSADLDEDDLDA